MPSLRLNRRTVLRGAGSVAIALPWLEIMGHERLAHAQAGTARRFLAVYTPGGSVVDDGPPVEWAPNANHRNRWAPTGSETNFTLSPILAPLEAVKSKLLVLEGLAMRSAQGEQHQAGIVAWLTGSVQDRSPRGYSLFPSIDQLIASRISRGKKPKASLQMAIRWATGGSKGLLSPINCANYEDNPSADPIPPSVDPVAIYNDLFGSLGPSDGTGVDGRIARKKSILDLVDKKYVALMAKLGAADRAKLDQHLTKIREVEGALDAAIVPGLRCQPPELLDPKGYNAKQGTDFVLSTDEMIPAVGRFMTDMMVMAFACDLTSVGTLQWTDTEAQHTFPWLGLTEHHHFYQHDGGFRPVECEKICTWYSEQHAYLLSQLDQIDVGGHTLLDESVVFFGSELSDPPNHSKHNMPFLLAGRGGGLKSGRHIKFSDALGENSHSHSNLLVSILNLFGDERTVCGDPEYCAGPLAQLV